MSPPPPRLPRPRISNGTRHLGQYSLLGFASFCGIFAAAAIMLDRTSPNPTKKPIEQQQQQQKQTQPNQRNDFDTLMQDESGDVAPPLSNVDDPSGPQNPPPQQQQQQQPDYFNRHRGVRIPYVLRSMASAERAQAAAAATQSAANQRQQTKEERAAAASARQQDVRRRQQEMERFTESRRLAQEGGAGGARDQTPRGRQPERNGMGMGTGVGRQRSTSTASDTSSSSFSDFWDERGR